MTDPISLRAPFMDPLTLSLWKAVIRVEVEWKETTFYLTVSRNSYFPLYYAQIHAYLSGLHRPREGTQMLPPPDSHWWLSFGPIPLQWHLPIGLLYDTLRPNDPSSWRLTLHVEAFPTQLVPVQGPDPWPQAVKSVWLNLIKEACFIQYGTAKSVMLLSTTDSDVFWESVVNLDPTTYTKLWNRVFLQLPTRNVPLKLYVMGTNQPVEVIQAPVGALGATLHQALVSLLPSLFAPAGAALALPIIHSAVIPGEAPVVELYKCVRYVDGFLHLVIQLMD